MTQTRTAAPPVLLAVAFGSTIAALLLALQVMIGNVHIGTTNGLWKSIDVQRWMTSAPWAIFNPVPGGLTSNALLYVTHANLGRLYDSVGVFPQMIWRQMAVTNALFAGLGAAAVFLFVARWQSSRLLALLAGTAYSLSGYVLLHGLTNEDIMPGFVLVLIATLMACAWFGAPTLPRIAAVAFVFALGWLYEWRLIFPSLPPLLLALFLAPGRAWERLARPAWFLAIMVTPPLLLALHATWARGGGRHALIEMVMGLFWTGKGVGSAWAGFNQTKVLFSWSGPVQSVVFGRHIAQPGELAQRMPEVWVATAVALLLALAALVHFLRHRSDARVRAAAVVLGGTFACGVIFNLYSQPQDPQMQVNVMIWALFGWTVLLGSLLAAARSPNPAPLRAVALAAAVLVAAAAPAASLATMREYAGQDRVSAELSDTVARQFPRDRTVFVLYDWDGFVTWFSALWQKTEPGTDSLPSAPAVEPLFKWIGIVAPVDNPARTGTQHAAELLRQMGIAEARGYRLIASPFWNLPEHNWIDALAQVIPAEKAVEIRRVLHAGYTARPVWQDVEGKSWYELRRR